MVFFWLNLRLFVLESSANRPGVRNSGNISAVTSVTTARGAAVVESSGNVVEDNLEAAVASSEYGGIAVVDNVQYRKFSKFPLLNLMRRMRVR